MKSEKDIRMHRQVLLDKLASGIRVNDYGTYELSNMDIYKLREEIALLDFILEEKSLEKCPRCRYVSIKEVDE